jgi:hypothetical protein
MSLNNNALCTVAQCKAYLDIASADTSQDSKLELLINAASSLIENYLDRKLVYQQYVEYHDGRNSDRLLLKEWPAIKPTEIIFDQTWTFNSSNIIPVENYQLESEVMVVLKGYKFPRGNRNIKVTYYAGYQSPVNGGSGQSMPAEIVQAAIMTVAWQYQLRADRRLGVASKGKQGESVSYVKGLPQEIAFMLDLHFRIEVPFAEVGVENG